MKWSSMLLVMILLNAQASAGQSEKGFIRWFSVAGKVLDLNGRPIQWGRIWVKDTQAHRLKAKPINPDGRFAIKWLDSRLDYEIYAEQGSAVSDRVIVSGNRSSKNIVIELKLGKNQQEK
jgi:hypothetical protein